MTLYGLTITQDSYANHNLYVLCPEVCHVWVSEGTMRVAMSYLKRKQVLYFYMSNFDRI